MIFAVTQQTAPELITARANPNDSNFGLLSWKGDKVRKQDIVIAKNYLTEDEIDTLNRLIVIFLETAELRAKSRKETRTGELYQKFDQDRKRQEAMLADQQDDSDLIGLETKVKGRLKK